MSGLCVFRRPGLEVEKRFLEHVGRIGPPLQAAIQAQPDHAAQPVAVVFPDPPEHLRIGATVADQLDRVFAVVQVHRRVTTAVGDCNTRKMTFSPISRLHAPPSPGASEAMRAAAIFRNSL
jgi:hypothetical protein